MVSSRVNNLLIGNTEKQQTVDDHPLCSSPIQQNKMSRRLRQQRENLNLMGAKPSAYTVLTSN